MPALPSFIELMDSLGLEQTSSPSPELSPSPSPSPSSSPILGGITAPSLKSRSSPSLRDISPRHRAPRYSPYSQSLSYTRRGSSSSSSSDLEKITTQDSSSPPPSSLRARRSRNQLTVNVYGSISDLPAYTPISSYVRRKTPGASPTSPTFPRPAYESVDITLPILPSFPNSASTDSSFPNTPASDVGASSPRPTAKALIITECTDLKSPPSHRRWHTGVRISTPPFSAGIDDISRRRSILHLA